MMKRLMGITVGCLLMGLTASCSLIGSSTPTPELFEYEKDAVTLHLAADRQLNQVKGKAHTLYLVVYQLSDPNRFNQLCEDPDGLHKLLESKSFDASVSSVKGMVVYPGSDVTHKIDRSQNARYIGVVAGYSVLAKERMARLYKVPVRKLGKYMRPERMEIDLFLSPTQIVEQ